MVGFLIWPGEMLWGAENEKAHFPRLVLVSGPHYCVLLMTSRPVPELSEPRRGYNNTSSDSNGHA